MDMLINKLNAIELNTFVGTTPALSSVKETTKSIQSGARSMVSARTSSPKRITNYVDENLGFFASNTMQNVRPVGFELE